MLHNNNNKNNDNEQLSVYTPLQLNIDRKLCDEWVCQVRYHQWWMLPVCADLLLSIWTVAFALWPLPAVDAALCEPREWKCSRGDGEESELWHSDAGEREAAGRCVQGNAVLPETEGFRHGPW